MLQKNRYILIIILAIIILLLIFIGIVVAINNNNNSSSNIDNNTENIKEKDDDIMIIEMESKKKEEEEKQKEIEKQEEQNAKGIIYLTFDDGPSLDTTPTILDILKQKNVKATFFVINYNEERESLIKQEDEEGHTVALHGYTHTYSEVYSSPEACMNNFKKIQEKVYNTIGKESKILRFPGGGSNTISRKYYPGIMTEVTQRVIDEGYKYYDWNVDSDDAGKAKTSEEVYNNLINGIKENRSNVVLMHDFSKNNKTVEALPKVIDYCLESGYVFRKITEETPMVRHSVNN